MNRGRVLEICKSHSLAHLRDTSQIWQQLSKRRCQLAGGLADLLVNLFRVALMIYISFNMSLQFTGPCQAALNFRLVLNRDRQV